MGGQRFDVTKGSRAQHLRLLRTSCRGSFPWCAWHGQHKCPCAWHTASELFHCFWQLWAPHPQLHSISSPTSSPGHCSPTSGSFHSTSGYWDLLPYFPVKTDLVGISGPKEEANKEKEMCGTESLNRQGSLDSREDERAPLILSFTLYNVRKTELSKAAEVFEVQTSTFLSFAEPSLLSLLPSCLPAWISPSLILLLLPACLTPHAAFPLSHYPGSAPAARRSGLVSWPRGRVPGGREHLGTVFRKNHHFMQGLFGAATNLLFLSSSCGGRHFKHSDWGDVGSQWIFSTYLAGDTKTTRAVNHTDIV